MSFDTGTPTGKRFNLHSLNRAFLVDTPTTLVCQLARSVTTLVVMSDVVNRTELAECHDRLVAARTPTELLHAITEFELALTEAREAVVADVMLDPLSNWGYAHIGEVLGISRQGARKRYDKVVQAEMRRRLKRHRVGQDAVTTT